MRLYPAELVLENFRNFRNVSISLGKKITIISGVNGVGKSNILSLVASGSGINKRSSLGSNFQPEFYDFFNIDINEQYQEYKMFLKYKTDDGIDAIEKRLSFKDDTEDYRGIRIIPRTTNEFRKDLTVKKAEERAKALYGVGGAARVRIPTIYLSLSRLYPLGEKKEQTHVNKIRKSNQFAQEEIRKTFRDWYNRVIPGAIKDEAEISIVDKKASSRASLHMDMDGIPTLSQSIGQDNVGNIISALIDIYILSKEDDYNGALLCIDEIEVSLHPDTQIRIMDLLFELSGILSLQIIVSTHSLTVLKEGLGKENKVPDDVKVVYLKNPSMPVSTSVKNYELLKADMFDKIKYQVIHPKIYFEDEVGKELFDQHVKSIRYILSQIESSNDISVLRNYDKISNPDRIKTQIMACGKILDIERDLKKIVTHCGCDELIDISMADEYFKRVIILLDGDARIKNKNLSPQIQDYLNENFLAKEKGINDREHNPNMVFAPGYFAPESYLFGILYRLIKNQIDYMDFWRGVDQNEEITLYTADRVWDLFSELPQKFNNDDLKKIFGEDPNRGDLWKFIKASDMISYYYSDCLTVENLICFSNDVINAYNMTKPLTVANKRS